MVKEIKIMLEKYKEIQKRSEFITTGQVVNDLYSLLSDARIKRLPKNER